MGADAPPRATVREGGSYAAERYTRVRELTMELASPLTVEDQVGQSMPDASPVKWHLAHTTWFFETFVLLSYARGYRAFDPSWGALFNSYYNALGSPFPRPRRGTITRPGVADVARYRERVDSAMRKALTEGLDAEALERLELGLRHEQQHQELLLMDVKHLFWSNPLEPAYAPVRSDERAGARAAAPLS